MSWSPVHHATPEDFRAYVRRELRKLKQELLDHPDPELRERARKVRV